MPDRIIAPHAHVKVLVSVRLFLIHPLFVHYLTEMAKPHHGGHVFKIVAKNLTMMAQDLKKNLSNWLRNGTAFRHLKVVLTRTGDPRVQ